MELPARLQDPYDLGDRERLDLGPKVVKEQRAEDAVKGCVGVGELVREALVEADLELGLARLAVARSSISGSASRPETSALGRARLTMIASVPVPQPRSRTRARTPTAACSSSRRLNVSSRVVSLIAGS